MTETTKSEENFTDWDHLALALLCFLAACTGLHLYRDIQSRPPPSPHVVDDRPYTTRLTVWRSSPDHACRISTEACLRQFDHGPEVSEDGCSPYDAVTHRVRMDAPRPSLLFYEMAPRTRAGTEWSGRGIAVHVPNRAEGETIERLPPCPQPTQ